MARMAQSPHVPTEYSNHSANRAAVEVAGPQIGKVFEGKHVHEKTDVKKHKYQCNDEHQLYSSTFYQWKKNCWPCFQPLNPHLKEHTGNMTESAELGNSSGEPELLNGHQK